MRVNGPLRPWRRHTSSYLVPAHLSDRNVYSQWTDDEDEAIAQALLQQLVPVAMPLTDEHPHGTYLHGWRDGYAAGYHAAMARARKRAHHKDTHPLGATLMRSSFDGGLHERSRYHL